jgi:hypothetical protein
MVCQDNPPNGTQPVTVTFLADVGGAVFAVGEAVVDEDTDATVTDDAALEEVALVCVDTAVEEVVAEVAAVPLAPQAVNIPMPARLVAPVA